MEKEGVFAIRIERIYGRVRSLMLNVNIDTLKIVYRELMENGIAVEIGTKYGEDLDKNLSGLLDKIKNCSFFPQSQDWIQRKDADGRFQKYKFRAFEDRIMQCLFEKILRVIYAPKVSRIIVADKKMDSIRKIHNKVKLYVAWLEVDVGKFLTKINQEDMIQFLEKDIADRSFIRYFRRILQSGVKLLGECTDSRCESIVPFLSMMCSVCEYYMLQILESDQNCELHGKMCMRRKGENFLYLFDNLGDAKIIYRRLYQGLKEMGLDITNEKICTLTTAFDYKKRFCKASLSRRTITRANNREVKMFLTK